MAAVHGPHSAEGGRVNSMTWGDRITILVAAGAITATVAAGTCSTNTRCAEMQADIRQVREDVQTDIRELRADVQADIRELRALVIDAIQGRTEEVDD